MRNRLATWIMAFAVLALVSVLGSASVSAAESEAKKYPDLALKGDAVCTRCHDDEDNAKIITIGATMHGTRADSRTPGCQSCHGESQAHIDNVDGDKVRPKVDVSFMKGDAASPEKSAEMCLQCHEGEARTFWKTSEHAGEDLACSSCHTSHISGTDPVQDKTKQPEVCRECHIKQTNDMHKPSRHPIVEGKVVCSDCHNPHGSPARASMDRATVNDTCFKCHAEKRGPFLWNHQPVTEDCSLCHNPHGTVYANLLKQRVPFLCQQCHEGTSHRGSAAAIGSNFTMGRGCLNCHTNIHGSNNAASDDDNTRSFRR